jgi:hypothetical protein
VHDEWGGNKKQLSLQNTSHPTNQKKIDDDDDGENKNRNRTRSFNASKKVVLMMVVVVKTRTWFLVTELWQSSLFTATSAKTKQST